MQVLFLNNDQIKSISQSGILPHSLNRDTLIDIFSAFDFSYIEYATARSMEEGVLSKYGFNDDEFFSHIEDYNNRINEMYKLKYESDNRHIDDNYTSVKLNSKMWDDNNIIIWVDDCEFVGDYNNNVNKLLTELNRFIPNYTLAKTKIFKNAFLNT